MICVHKLGRATADWRRQLFVEINKVSVYLVCLAWFNCTWCVRIECIHIHLCSSHSILCAKRLHISAANSLFTYVLNFIWPRHVVKSRQADLVLQKMRAIFKSVCAWMCVQQTRNRVERCSQTFFRNWHNVLLRKNCFLIDKPFFYVLLTNQFFLLLSLVITTSSGPKSLLHSDVASSFSVCGV